MEQFLNIKQAIYDYFVNTEGKQYIEDIGTIYSIARKLCGKKLKNC